MGSDGLLDRIRNSRIVRKPGYRWLAGALIAGSLIYSTLSNPDTSKPIEETRGEPSTLEYKVEGNPSQEEARKYWEFDLRPDGNKAHAQNKTSPPEKQPRLIEFLDQNDIDYDIMHNRLFLPETTIQKIADLVGISADETRTYLCTEKHKSILFDPIDENPLLRKAIMTVESSGFGRCNSLNFCGLMQLGDEAVTEVLRITTQYAFSGTGKEFDDFRKDDPKLLASIVDLLDQHSEGYISKLSQLNQDIAKAKEITNALYEKYDQLVIENQNHPDNYDRFSKARRELGKYNRFLSAANEYFAGIVFALESHPEEIESKRKSKKEFRRNVQAKKAISGRLATLAKERKKDYSTAIKLVAEEDPSLGYLTTANIDDLAKKEFSPRTALRTFSAVWDSAKDDDKLNVGISRLFTSYLQHTCSKDMVNGNGQLRKEFEGIDPLRYLLEVYNKGHGFTKGYVLKNGELPPAAKGKEQSYSEHVTSTLQMILEFNKLIYGDEHLKCSIVDGGVECQLPQAVKDYVSMLER